MIIYCPNCKKIIKDTCVYCPHCDLRIYTQKEVDSMGVINYPRRFRVKTDNNEYNTEQGYYEADSQGGYYDNGYGSNQTYQYERARSGNTILIVTIFVLLMVIIAGAGYFFYDYYLGGSKVTIVDGDDYYDNPDVEQSVNMDDFNNMDTQQQSMATDEDDSPVTGAPVVEEPAPVRHYEGSNEETEVDPQEQVAEDVNSAPTGVIENEQTTVSTPENEQTATPDAVSPEKEPSTPQPQTPTE